MLNTLWNLTAVVSLVINAVLIGFAISLFEELQDAKRDMKDAGLSEGDRDFFDFWKGEQ